MNKWGSRSWEKLNSGVHAKLIALTTLVAIKINHSIDSGRRGETEQNDIFKRGASKLVFPNSAHNKDPSRAIDVVPYPLDWKDLESFQKLRDAYYEAATELGIGLKPIIEFNNGTFDYPHIELDNSEI